MKPFTRWSVVLATLGTCALASFLQIQEEALRKDPPPSELFDVIQAGILGLRSQHYQQVYQQASRNYRERQDFDQFRERIRSDCLAIRRAIRWEFGVPRSDNSGFEVPVHFFLQSSEVYPAKFTVVRENHAWKIESVQLPVGTLQPKTLGGIRL